jgi:membrane fusion protein, multidrug efflux system
MPPDAEVRPPSRKTEAMPPAADGAFDRQSPRRGEPDKGGDVSQAANDEAKPKRSGRLRVVAAVAVVVAVAGLGYYLYGRRFESTDDAEVDADISNIGARVSGTVTRVNIAENQRVRAGDVIAEIDPTDLEVALAQAKASVAQAAAQLEAEDPAVSITENSNVAALSNASANISSASAGLAGAERDVEQAAAHLAEARANARTADLDLRRGQQLVDHDAIPRAEFDRRQSAAAATAAAVDGAQKAVEAARDRASQQEALMSGIRSRLVEVRKNSPRQVDTQRATVAFREANLELAKAQARQAELNLGYATVKTPVAGVVARKAVNVGDMVTPGQALAAITDADAVWVTANFRETQLRRMRVGQSATIHVDAINRDLSGSVESLGGATGSRVSVFPPENATGNYVKVVQRIPVRIRLDPGQADLDRLRPGMSVEPKVRVTE